MIKAKTSVRVAVAQFRAIRGDIERNAHEHIKLIKSAAEQNVDVIVFPELSLTGYELDLATSLQLSTTDIDNLKIKKIADKLNMTVVIGAPVYAEEGRPKLGAIIFRLDQAPVVAGKINLHHNLNLPTFL